MSLQGLQQLLAERRRIKEAEVAGKVDLLRQLNKIGLMLDLHNMKYYFYRKIQMHAEMRCKNPVQHITYRKEEQQLTALISSKAYIFYLIATKQYQIFARLSPYLQFY